MSVWSKRAAFLAVAFVTSGCVDGRVEAGPLESEYGSYFFWEVSSIELEFEDCTDNPAWRDGISAPPLEPNSFLIYQVSEDGQRAITQDCTTTDTSSCAPSATGIVFDVDAPNHTLVWSAEPQQEALGSVPCELHTEQVWTAVDGGEDLALDAALALDLEGDELACQRFDDELKGGGTNEFGVDGCIVHFRVASELFTVSE